MIIKQSNPGVAFHGWKILFLAAFSQFVSVGFTVYLLGLYFKPLAEAFSATPGQLGWTSSIFMLLSAGLGPLLGYWVDKGMVKWLMILGAACLSLGFVSLSLCVNLVQAALVCIFLVAPGTAMIGIVTAGAMLSQWFERRRGLALAIAAGGISLGGFFMPAIAAWLFDSYGWRLSSLAFGLFIALTLLPCAWFIAVARPADIGQFPDGIKSDEAASGALRPAPTIGSTDFSALLARVDFWLITLTVGAVSFASITIITYLIPLSQERGIDLKTSAFMLSLYAGAAFFGKCFYGWLADKFTPARLLTSVAAIMAIGLLPMLNSNHLAIFVASICIIGLGVGGLMPIWATLVASNFGAQSFGKVKGAMSLMLTSVSIIPGPLGGYIHDAKGSYGLTFTVVLWVLVSGAAISLLIPSGPDGKDTGSRRHPVR